MGNYFIVLQLPHSSKLRFEDGKKDPVNFWAKTAGQIENKKAKLLCSRCDTGVSEALRLHAEASDGFATYVLLNIPLEIEELQNENTILHKAALLARNGRATELIDSNKNFQLITAA